MQKDIKVVFEVNKRLEVDDRARLIHSIEDLHWQAVMEFILEQIEDCTEYTTNEAVVNEHGSLAYYSGGLATLRLLFAKLKDTHDKGNDSV